MIKNDWQVNAKSIVRETDNRKQAIISPPAVPAVRRKGVKQTTGKMRKRLRQYLLLPLIIISPSLPGAPPPRAIAEYQALVAELEAAGGVYGERMIEAQRSLGALYQQVGNHPAAIAALQRALQSLRVNEGLYSMNQAAILEAIIDSHIALDDRDELRRNYERLYWVYRRNYGENNAALIPVINRIGKWYFDLYNFSPPGTTVEPLIAADDLYAKALALIPEDDPAKPRVDILYNIAVINYHVAEDVLDSKLSHREIREAMIPHGRGSPYLNETAVRQYYSDQSFFRGKRSLNKIVEIYARNLPATIIEYAQALIFMGDWFTVQRRVWDGAKLYQRAYAALVEHDASPAMMERLLGAPKPIEQLPVPGEEEVQVNNDSYYVDALLDVPASGWPRNIRIQSVHPPDETSLFKRGKRAISATRYRPRFRDGQPIATADVKLRYIFKRKEQPGRFHF